MNKYLMKTVLCGWVIAFSTAIAQTEVEGEVSGEWNAEGSPYIVVDSTWVQEGEELYISEGVTVQFAAQTGLYVYGMITVIGTEEDSIHFTSNEEGEEWAGIYFYQQEEEYQFEYSTIRNAVNGLVSLSQTYLSVINCDINCSYIAFGVLDPNAIDQGNNRYYFENSNVVGGRVTPFDNCSLTAIGSYFATGSGEQWGFTNRGSVELTDCEFIGSIRSWDLRGIFRRCNFYHAEDDYIGITVSGAGALMQDCYVDGHVNIIANQSEFLRNEIVNNLSIQLFSGLVEENEVGGRLSIRHCSDPVTIKNCIVNMRVTLSQSDDVEMYECHILGNHDSATSTLLLSGGGRYRDSAYSVHHNLILGSVRTEDEIELEMVNNTIISFSSDRFGLIQANTNWGSLLFSNNIIICTVDNLGLYNPRGNAANDAIFTFNLINGFEQFSFRDQAEDFDLDESNLFDVDPLLVSLDPLDPRPTADSPCVDAGDPESPLDPDSTRADIGMFYYHQDLRVIELKEVKLPINELLSVYPNPFNGVSTFAFTLDQPSAVKIDIFNAIGRRELELMSGSFSAGKHSISWDGGGLPSGDYLIRMTANGQVLTRKVSRIK